MRSAVFTEPLRSMSYIQMLRDRPTPGRGTGNGRLFGRSSGADPMTNGVGVGVE